MSPVVNEFPRTRDVPSSASRCWWRIGAAFPGGVEAVPRNARCAFTVDILITPERSRAACRSAARRALRPWLHRISGEGKGKRVFLPTFVTFVLHRTQSSQIGLVNANERFRRSCKLSKRAAACSDVHERIIHAGTGERGRSAVLFLSPTDRARPAAHGRLEKTRRQVKAVGFVSPSSWAVPGESEGPLNRGWTKICGGENIIKIVSCARGG